MNISIDRKTKKLTIEVDVSMLSEDHSSMKTSQTFKEYDFNGDPTYTGMVSVSVSWFPGEEDNENANV